MGFRKEDLVKLKKAVRMSDVVGRYLDLRPQGGRLVGVCPFHNESNASLSVNDEDGFFYCFGCQASGDVIDFFSRINGFDFRETVVQLADMAGLDIRDDYRDDGREKVSGILKVLAEAQGFFAGSLPGSPGERYLGSRKVSKESVSDFGIGWCGRGQGFLRPLVDKFGWEALGEAGLAKNGDHGWYSLFSDRVMFPITDVAGRVVSFGGRIIGDSDPKYLNGPETAVFKKREHLFGLPLAKAGMMKTHKALVTEGYMDVVSMRATGADNTVGVLGTAVTANQCRKLGSFCDCLTMLFDGDEAGRKAAFNAVSKAMEAGKRCEVVILPDGEDADSMSMSDPEGLRVAMESAIEGMEYFVGYLETAFPHPGDMLDKIRGVMENVPAELSGFYAKRISDLTGLAKDGILPVMPATGKNVVSLVFAGQERNIVSFLFRNPRMYSRLAKDGVGDTLVSKRGRDLWRRLDEGFADNPMGYLETEEEKALYARCRITMDGQPDPEREYQDMARILKEERDKAARVSVEKKIKEAEDRGDFEEALRIAAGEGSYVSF